MLSDNNSTRIAQGCARFGIPTPKAAKAAEALNKAAEALRANIRAENAPDLDNLTAANVETTHSDLVTFANRDARLAAAEEIVNRAIFARAIAWHEATPALVEAFRTPYNNAAARFTTALATLEGHTDAQWAIDNGKADAHAALTQAGDDLTTLALIRDALATVTQTGIMPREVDKITRITRIPSVDTVLRRIPVRAEGHATYSLGWWTMLTQLDGVTLEWHTPDEQLQVTLDLPSERPREFNAA